MPIATENDSWRWKVDADISQPTECLLAARQSRRAVSFLALEDLHSRQEGEKGRSWPVYLQFWLQEVRHAIADPFCQN
jgi:hypothetical protein